MMLTMKVIKDNETPFEKKFSITRNQLNRTTLPQLHGEALYQLKKHKKVEIKLEDATLSYELAGT